ncbi:MAG: FAD-dependent thymidylate synthase [Candidatus Nealsonbacteria bacterium]|nr:FAD-dependent thymidylate synthase [Candidatus Nealsonbacteria bacterium]
MKPFLTRNLKVQFLGITPVLRDKTGVLNPQQIVALSALLTFKGKTIKNLFKEIKNNGENLDEKIKLILQKSSLRGHASISTTPSLCLTYEGSKFLDSALTGIYFSSSLVSSGRRTGTIEKDIVFPNKIYSNKKAKGIYQETSEKIIRFFNFLLSQEVKKDEASKILQYGIYGTGIIQLPIETIIGLKREYQREEKWMPEEVGILLRKIEKEAKKLGIDWLYATREAAPRNVFPFPNIFKDPKEGNLVRGIKKKIKLEQGARVVSTDILIPSELKKRLINLEKKTKETFSSLRKIKKDWQQLLSLRQEILRDYNLALRFKVLSSAPWRVWGEKKRHRTCLQVIESIYYCVDRAAKVFRKFERQIRKGKINKRITREVGEVFSIPPSIKQKQELLSEYLLVALRAFGDYKKLINLGIKPKEAIFLIPRATKIDILQEYDLYNLLTGYYPLRLCKTAEEEMRRNTLKEVAQIKNVLAKKGYGWLNGLIGPKCEIIGFCPEEKSCAMIKTSVRKYNDKFHQEMKEELKRLFQENLKNLGE